MSVARCPYILLVSSLAVLSAQGFDPSDRWQVRDYFNSVYNHKVEAPMEWTGDYTSGQSGTVSADWLEATLNRVNYFRTVAGVPADITFDPVLNAKCQQAALMLSANGILSHYPPESWTWWTQDGYDAANSGNIAIGSSGPESIEGYMMDPGDNNFVVGHRRWILFPQTTVMGSGDVPGDPQMGLYAANALWVHPASIGARPPTRDDFVAWPPPGNIPAQTVWPRWSISHPQADFTNASVSMTSGGITVPVVLEPYQFSFGYPESTLVWVPGGLDPNAQESWTVPVEDTAYTVKVDNVQVGGQTRSFEYTVTIIDPAAAGPGEYDTTVAVAEPVYAGVPAWFTKNGRAWAEGFETRVFTGEPHAVVYGAESGLDPLLASVSTGYDPVQGSRRASGSRAYHLVHPEYRGQILALPGEFLIGSGNPSLDFMSSLSYATAFQTATVEMRLGGAGGWSTLWDQPGNQSYSATFTPVSIDLSAWSGHTAEFRFHYKVVTGQSFFPQTTDDFGWAIDAISFSGVERVGGQAHDAPGVSGSRFAAVIEGPGAALMQVRDTAFNGVALEWGPALEIDSLILPAVQAPDGQWVDDPVFGWVRGMPAGWKYCPDIGFMQLDAFPWIHTPTGWMAYLYGSVHDGLWMVVPGQGTLFIE